MYRLQNAFQDLLYAAVFLIPIFLLLWKIVFHSLKKTAVYLILAFYLTAVVSLVGFPNILYFYFDFTYNFIPFADIIPDFENSCLNILMFIPLGIFLPLLWDKYRNIKSTLIFSFSATCFIEIMQIFTHRTTDINDIITNTLGALIGYFIIKFITSGFKRFVIDNKSSKDLYIICAVSILVMFFLQPLILPALG